MLLSSYALVGSGLIFLCPGLHCFSFFNPRGHSQVFQSLFFPQEPGKGWCHAVYCISVVVLELLIWELGS